MTSQDCPVSCSEAVSCTPDTTFTVQFYRQSRENSLFPAVSAIPLQLNFTDKVGKITVSYSVSHHLYCSILQIKQGKFTVSCSARHYLLQQTFTKDGVLNILLVVENEACYDGAKQCC